MYIEGNLARATFHEWRNGGNPAKWNGDVEHEFVAQRESDVEHIPMIPLDDVQPYASELGAQGRGHIYRALELLLLTNVRTYDIRHARWDQLDTARAEWAIPKVSKLQKPFTVPLCDRAVAILKALPKINAYVFAGRSGPIGEREFGKAMKRLRPGLSPHSSRSSFKTWSTTRTSFPPDVVEEAMLHRIGNHVERSYSRAEMLDKRRHLMTEWGRYCSTPTPAATGEVIALRRK